MTQKLRCPSCGKKLFSTLKLHLDIAHNIRLTDQECQMLTNENWKKIFNSAAKTAPLKVSVKSGSFLGSFGVCDLCQDLHTRRWQYLISNKGKINLCWKCRDSLNKQSYDVFDSRKILPGSFGG